MEPFRPVKRIINIEAFYLSINETRPKDFIFSGELHDFWEAVLIYEGEAIATGDERVYNLKAGDLLFHKPMEFHRIASANNTAPHCIILSFKASGEGMKAFENQKFTLDYDFIGRYCRIADNISQAIELHKQKSPEYDFIASLATARLEHFLLQLSNENQESNNIKSKEALLYEKIVMTMTENCHTALSIDEIASICNMSTSNLKRIFKMFSDISPAKYFLTLRLRKSMQLLDEGKSIQEITNILDFSNTAYFCTSFRRELGLTPSQYKKIKNRD